MARMVPKYAETEQGAEEALTATEELLEKELASVVAERVKEALPPKEAVQAITTDQLAQLSQQIINLQDEQTVLDASLRKTLERLEQQRVDGLGTVERDYADGCDKARQGHLAARREIQRQLGDLVAERHALLLAYEALRARSG